MVQTFCSDELAQGCFMLSGTMGTFMGGLPQIHIYIVFYPILQFDYGMAAATPTPDPDLRRPVAPTVTHGELGREHVEEEEWTKEEYEGDRRLTVAERAAGPHRPQEWQEVIRSLRSLDPEVSSRTMSIVRRWLVLATEQHGATFTVLRMMLRDVVSACSLFPLPADQDAIAQREANRVISVIQRFPRGRFESPTGASQPLLVHEGLLLAIRVDEMTWISSL